LPWTFDLSGKIWRRTITKCLRAGLACHFFMQKIAGHAVLAAVVESFIFWFCVVLLMAKLFCNNGMQYSI
jgi:hypothetical protein